MRILLWFHRDLRTHDHAGLNWALTNNHETLGITFPPHQPSSIQKLKFWKETVDNLSENLNKLKISLEISEENPLVKIPELVKAKDIEKIITHRRMNYRDQQELKKVAEKISIEIVQMGDLTLYESNLVSELTIQKLRPFTGFKNYITSHWTVPRIIPQPLEINLKNPDDHNWETGGEQSGLIRLQDYVWNSRSCLHYHQTRNGMINRDDSSKFSRWLALGALSPRMIFHELKRLEAEIGSSEGISALIYELIWRDYFKYLAYLMEDKFFSREGLRSSPFSFGEDGNSFLAWRNGETGEDFVDANMRELLLTGWMSNRGRQNVASYLAKTIKLDWILGAKWFEEQLIDEDPENNWGNWQYFSGVGTDPRDRIFDMKRQASLHDPENHYQESWLSQTKEREILIMKLLSTRSPESTICPSEILRSEEKKNKCAMDEVRSSARRLYNMEKIDFLQKGEKIDPYNHRGPIRLKLR